MADTFYMNGSRNSYEESYYLGNNQVALVFDAGGDRSMMIAYLHSPYKQQKAARYPDPADVRAFFFAEVVGIPMYLSLQEELRQEFRKVHEKVHQCQTS